jgi:tetratricopeptide (TPR) repeat protein
VVLFHATENRYEILPPVQSLGLSHLSAQSERAVWRAKHASLIKANAERTDCALRSADEPRVHAVFDDTIAELRAARAWLMESGDMAGLLDLCASMHWFNMLRTRSEITRWADAAVDLVDPGASSAKLGRAYASAAMGAAKRGDLAEAERLAEAGAHTVDGRFCVEILAQVNLYRGHLEDAIACCRRAADLHTAAGDALFAINAASVEPAALAYGGELDSAEHLARQLARSADELGVPSLRAMSRYILAETLPTSNAVRAYQESLALARSVGADFVIGVVNTSLAAREIRAGRSESARERLAEAINHWQRTGVRTQQWLAIRLLVEVVDRDGEYAAVARLAGAYSASAHAGPAYGDDARLLKDAIERACAYLGDEQFAVVYGQGAALSDDQAAAVAQALARRRAWS